ncbi:MAG: TIGR03960 family B12-binding radical SAM protein [Nitrospirota bacterium]|nr:TIGR03960 family B12-binding radical SAM protein [Nitrospirota bacterium]
MNLLSFKKPGRYINSEVNSIHKKAPVTFALAFPDMYEIGMSHLGHKILYDIMNNIPYASAERVFSPWLDLGDAMRKSGVLLSSLESDRPLKDFDIVGFSLQYELSYTTVLDMLDLGGIPLRSGERLDSKKKYPLVIAGGPCTVNPFPMSAFIDVFLIGDGEEAVTEILEVYHEWQNSDLNDKHSLLKSLAEIEGLFVPSLGKDRRVNRRFISSLEDAPFPDSPVLPFVNIVHDRVNIEIARGCSRGCRFCQAGMICRPVRERSPENIIGLAERSLRNTGYDSISFTSLSAGDYSCLPRLMKEVNRRFHKKRISMSLPSLRVASVNRDILSEIRAVRKTGFTIAPEAGTDRLRAVINKDFSEETYANALETLFREGWRNLKLYFMTGLPTETDADIAAIPEMVFQAIRTSKRHRGRHVNISAGVSPFIPKPHTPFQWSGQNDLAVLREKNHFLKRAFLRRGVKFKGHNEEMSLLEAVFARGDESLADLIESAWALGCRLDAWTEAFDFEKWKKAMDTTGIEAPVFAVKEYKEDSPLPWDNINTGISREYLMKEYRNALAGIRTPDCRTQCHNCGLKCGDGKGPDTDEIASDLPAATVIAAENGGEGIGPAGSVLGYSSPRPGNVNNPVYADQGAAVKVRLRFSKTGKARYLSHLETTTAIIRAMRRAEFNFRYSSGFHPSPRISFGPALRVGIAGLREYLDLELIPPVRTEAALRDLNRTLPEGFHADRMEMLFSREKSLNSFIIRYTYEIKYGEYLDIDGFMEKKEVFVQRDDKLIDIRKLVDELIRIDDRTVRLTVRDRGEIKARLDEILQAVFGLPAEELNITRLAMFGQDEDWRELLNGEKRWAMKS